MRKHGHSYHFGKATAEYNAWSSMKSRCQNQNCESYSRYGGRGISVCKEWVMSFSMFIDNMGERPSPKHSLGRKDNDGDYTPENCRWETRKEQARNRSNNRIVAYGGKEMTLIEAAERAGVSIILVRSRIKRGWPIGRALS